MHMNLILHKTARNLLQNDWQIYPKSCLNDTKVQIYKLWHCPSTLRKSYQIFDSFLSPEGSHEEMLMRPVTATSISLSCEFIWCLFYLGPPGKTDI